MKVAAAVLASLIMLVSCGDLTGSSSGTLRIRATPPVLQFNNTARATVYSFTVEREASALVDWVPCTDTIGCNPLAAGETRAEPYSSMFGYTPSAREAIVYWWHLIPDGSGAFKPDSVRIVVIRL